MPRYYFEAIDYQGRRAPGSLECDSEESLIRILEQKGQTLIRAGIRPLAGPTSRSRRLSRGNVGSAERAEYASQMARLLASGCPLDRAQQLVADTLESERMARAVEEIRVAITQGASFAQALERQPDVFSGVFVAAVRAAETGGFLGTMLERLSAMERRQSELRRKLAGALVYPAFLALTMLLSGGILLGFVLPSMLAFLRESGAELPASTRALLFVSENAVELSAALLALVLGAIGLRAMAVGSPGGREAEHRLWLALPLAGPIALASAVAAFCRTLALLLGGGVSLPRALELTRDAVGNRVLQREIAAAHANVLAGEPLSRALEVSPLLGGALSARVGFGEESGAVERELENLARDYEARSEAGLEAVTRLAEPVMVVGMGLLMGTLVLGLFQPIVQMVNLP